jgi:hypothetical protein
MYIWKFYLVESKKNQHISSTSAKYFIGIWKRHFIGIYKNLLKRCKCNQRNTFNHLGDYLKNNFDNVTTWDWFIESDKLFAIFTMIKNIHDKKMTYYIVM